VDFVNAKNSLINLLGFEKNILLYQVGYHIAENHANISHIQTIHIDCDLIDSNHILNSKTHLKKPVIYSFPAYTIPIGSCIVEKPFNPTMFNVGKKTIDFININIYDDDGAGINFNGELFSIEIL